jgi:hypothetical protein
MTPDDIRKAAELVFPRRCGHCAVIGSLKGREKALEELLKC